VEIYKEYDSLYILERNNKKLVVFAFIVSYCPQFWDSGVIYKAHDTLHMFERHDRKLVVFAFMTVFMSYCPQFLGSGVI
jgi:hypothetical protein